MKPSASSKGAFPATRWTLILDAQEDNPQALADLCRDYWFPLYCYARHLRSNPADAEDLTQAFFEHVLSRDGFGKARRERGKMRSFLLRALTNFSLDERKRERAQKRGRGVPLLSIDAAEAEERMSEDLHDTLSPEREFDRAWGRNLLRQVLQRLEASYSEAGKADLFAGLRGHLVPGGQTRPHAEVARDLGMSEAGVKFAAFKLRQRYRETLHQAIAETVSTPEEVEEELAYLREVFGN